MGLWVWGMSTLFSFFSLFNAIFIVHFVAVFSEAFGGEYCEQANVAGSGSQVRSDL